MRASSNIFANSLKFLILVNQYTITKFKKNYNDISFKSSLVNHVDFRVAYVTYPLLRRQAMKIGLFSMSMMQNLSLVTIHMNNDKACC
jgi:hypothetical protein